MQAVATEIGGNSEVCEQWGGELRLESMPPRKEKHVLSPIGRISCQTVPGQPLVTHGSLSKPNGRWIHDHLLSLSLLGLFLISWIGQLIFQYQHELEDAVQHGDESFPIFSAQFMQSFWASTLENWQSEFLQLLTFVVLTTFLIHRHSHESRDGQDEMAADIKAMRQLLEDQHLT